MAILLGRTSAGVTADFNATGDTAIWNFTAVLSGSLRTIYAKTKASTNTTVTAIRLGIYDDIAGTPTNLLGVASVDGLGVARGTGLFSATLATPVNIVAGTVYWLGWHGATANFNFQGDTVAGAYKETAGAADFQNPFSLSNPGNTTAIIWGESVDRPWPIRIPNKRVGPTALRQLFRQPYVASGTVVSGTIFNQPLTATATTTASLVTLVLRSVILTATATTTASIKRVVNKLLSATAFSTATSTRVVQKPLATTSTTTATIVRVTNKPLTATSTTTATMTRIMNKVMSASVISTATIQRLVSKALSATATTTATIVKVVGKRLTASASSTASIVTTFVAGGGAVVYNVAMTALVTTTGTIKMLVPPGSIAAAKRKIELFISRFGFYRH